MFCETHIWQHHGETFIINNTIKHEHKTFHTIKLQQYVSTPNSSTNLELQRHEIKDEKSLNHQSPFLVEMLRKVDIILIF